MKDFKRDIANILKNVKIVKLDKKDTTIFVQETLKKLNIKVLHQNDINHSKAVKNSIELESFQKSSRIRCYSYMQFFILDQKTKKFE